MQLCLCALFRSKRIGYPSLSRNRLHGRAPQREPQRASTFYRFSTPIEIFHECIKIGLNFPGYHRVLLLVSYENGVLEKEIVAIKWLL